MESDGASANVFGQRTRQLRDMKALPLARKDDMMSLHGGGRLGRISYGWRARLFTRCMWIFGDSAALCEKRRRNTAKSGGEINSNKRKKSNRGCGSTTNALCRWLDIEVRECFRSSLISSLGLLRMCNHRWCLACGDSAPLCEKIFICDSATICEKRQHSSESEREPWSRNCGGSTEHLH